MEDSPDLSKTSENLSNNNQESNGEILVTSTSIIEKRISVLAENGSAVEDGSHKRNASPVTDSEIDAVSGIKRPRISVDEQQASVHVTYNSLTRESKRKLEELLQKWSEWHNHHQSSSHGEVESGEGTYYPALNVGLDKPSALSFWMDGQTKNLQSKEVIALDNSSVPLYDRGYSFGLSTDGPSNVEGGLDGGSRCFNCGSYNHALKECTKPRDHAAVTSARKQHKAKRNQNSMSRNPTRYYQDTPGGKFDGLRPGALDLETRKLLGIGELDPPPWLNRMREIGYPIGYLDDEEDEQPSGIEIFGDEEVNIDLEPPLPPPPPKLETEDGEILDMDCSPPPLPADEPPAPPPPPPEQKKMTIQFPGVNAPVPENADEWRWGARAWKFDLPRNRGNPRFYNNNNNSTESATRSHHHHHHHSQNEERWSSRGFREDGPPGVDPGSGGHSSSFSPRYNNNSEYESRGSFHQRSMSERGKRSPLIRETSSSHDDERWNPYSGDFLSHRKERHEDGHHRSWR